MTPIRDDLPGADLVASGLEALARGEVTPAALVVTIGAPRLRRLGVPVPDSAIQDPEHRLYLLLAATRRAGAHSAYNALIRRLVSFERAAACAA